MAFALSNKQIEKVESAKKNPLANYGLQITDNFRSIRKKIGDTSLAWNGKLELAGITNDEIFSINENLASFDYSKVITTAHNRDTILSLNPGAQSLFIWILFELDYLSDTVEIEFVSAKRRGLSLAPGTFREAIAELETKKLIKRVGKKRTKDYWLFFINPQVIFKGDAKGFYKAVLEAHPDYL